MKDRSLIKCLEEYFLRNEALKFYSENGKQYPDLKGEFNRNWWDVLSVSLITNTFTLTGLLTPFAPYYFDASNTDPCKGWATVMGLSAITCSEFLRNMFGRQFDREMAKYDEKLNIKTLEGHKFKNSSDLLNAC